MAATAERLPISVGFPGQRARALLLHVLQRAAGNPTTGARQDLAR